MDTVVATVEGEAASNLTIDEGSLAHIMQALTNMYADPHLAVAREYMANARDSHIEAGQDRPIEVTATAGVFGAEPEFIVKDYGVGMTRDEVESRYARYGASSKRDTNAQVGGFGIGCKSAFAVADAFTVEAVKDGELTVAAFTRGEDDAGAMTILEHDTSTDQPNGVTVRITVDERTRTYLTNAVRRLAAHWDVPLEINGHLIEPGERDRTGLPNGWFWSEHDNGLAVVMGGIYYRVTAETVRRLANALPEGPVRGALERGHYQNALVLECEVGQVDLPPSREAVRETPRSLTFLGEQLAALQEATVERWAHEIEDAENYLDACLILERQNEERRRFGGYIGDFVRSPRHGKVASRSVVGGNRTYAWDQREVSPIGGSHWVAPSAREHTFVVVGDFSGYLVRFARALLGHHKKGTVTFTNRVMQSSGWIEYGPPFTKNTVQVLSVEQFKELARPFLPKPEKRERKEPTYEAVKRVGDRVVGYDEATLLEHATNPDYAALYHGVYHDIHRAVGLDLVEKDAVFIEHPGHERRRNGLLRRLEDHEITNVRDLLEAYAAERATDDEFNRMMAIGHWVNQEEGALGACDWRLEAIVERRAEITDQAFLDFLDDRAELLEAIEKYREHEWLHHYGYKVDASIAEGMPRLEVPSGLDGLREVLYPTYYNQWVADFVIRAINAIGATRTDAN